MTNPFGAIRTQGSGAGTEPFGPIRTRGSAAGTQQFGASGGPGPQHAPAPAAAGLEAPAPAPAPATGRQLEARRERRPVELVRVISQLDAYQQAAQLDSAAAWIAHQYTIQDLGHLIGLFQQCSLGPPLVDHQLDLASLNLEHFTTGSIPPGPYPAARLLAAGDGCLYVEVYADGRLIPIGHDGRPGGEMSSDLRGLRSG